MKSKQPKSRATISKEVRARLTQTAKLQPVVTGTWHEATQNGNLVPMFTVKCQACGGNIHTSAKHTFFHPECSFSVRRPLSKQKAREKINKMGAVEKDRLLISLMQDVQEYQSRYGLLIHKDHIKVSDALIRAMKDKTRYALLNAIAREWLKDE